MPSGISNSTNPCRHDTHSGKTSDNPPLSVDIAWQSAQDSLVVSAMLHAFVSQQLIEPHIAEILVGRTKTQDQAIALIYGLEASGLITWGTALEFLPPVESV